MEWNKESIRNLRLRLGWTQSDLARRLHMSSTLIATWEEGQICPTFDTVQELELILHQADICCDEVSQVPVAEKICDQSSVNQIKMSDLHS